MEKGKKVSNLYAALPSVDLLLNSLALERGVELMQVEGESPLAYGIEGQTIPRAILREAANEFLDFYRREIKAAHFSAPEDLSLQNLLSAFRDFAYKKSRSNFRRVLNATGVVLHTNLGRAVLAEEAVKAVQDACISYSNLEMDLSTGQRGSRYSHVEELICKLTGAEAALVVNNNAAAVFIILDSLCKGKEVIVSRGQLVEIGGSFRIPEVMEKSGCILKEVGASNRTHLHDYERAIGSETAALLRVHQSNYRIIGFQGDVSLKEMVELGRKHAIPVYEDLGSGYLAEFSTSLMQSFARGEAPVQKVVADGAGIVTFSGDKILGGPQAGIIAGKKEFIEKIKKNPINRALRIDKMTLAALEATLRLYLEPELAIKRIPTLRMLCASVEDLRKKANRLRQRLNRAFKADSFTEWPAGLPVIRIEQGESKAGGGSFPEKTLATVLLSLDFPDLNPELFRAKLLEGRVPVIVRLQEGKIVLDLRTIAEDELTLLVESLSLALLDLKRAQ